MILIISFNARQIAYLAKQIGLEIAIVDFWGDLDLFPLSNKIYTVFKPEFKSYTKFSDQTQNEDLLCNLAFQAISNDPIEGVLIGSGWDDRPDLWEKINHTVPIYGNSPECIRIVRDLSAVQKVLKEERIKVPLTISAADSTEVMEFVMQVGFPIVIKPLKTLGGIGIQLLKTKSELIEFLNKNSENLNKYYVQEYISGDNISTTMVGNGKKYEVLSINEQLIGIKEFGTNIPFKYCGNIVPFNCSPEIAQIIEKNSLTIAKAFNLRGIFGIDFVLKNKIPYFMEINPRFPGTIELLAMVSQLNAVKLHLDAMRGTIPIEISEVRGYAMKSVLFAKKRFVTKNLGTIPHLVDIPQPNITLDPEEPICSIQLFDESREQLLKRMAFYVKQMYFKVEP